VSIVQSAMERLKSSRAADPRAVRTAAQTAPAAVLATNANLPLPVPWPETGAPRVEIDTGRLSERGLYPHSDHAHRQQEDYRTIRREVISATRQKPAPDAAAIGPIVVVTSALSGEGKSYTALSLALSIASEGIHEVLLIDADTVRHSITTAVDLGDAPGLVELLARPGRSFMEYARQTSVERLRVLPAGRAFEGASDLFSLGRVGPLFAAINSALDGHIAIIDTAPILLCSETPVLTDTAGQVLLVVRAGHTLQDSLKDAASRIKESVPVGLVLNDWDPLLASERQVYRGYEAYVKT
jgi:protein-tyrosine kinase